LDWQRAGDDPGALRTFGTNVAGHHVKQVLGQMQSSYGFDLELIAELDNGKLQHFSLPGLGAAGYRWSATSCFNYILKNRMVGAFRRRSNLRRAKPPIIPGYVQLRTSEAKAYNLADATGLADSTA
jgi:hypothetical protein